LVLAALAERLMLRALVQTDQILYLVALPQQAAVEAVVVQVELMAPVEQAVLEAAVRPHQGMREAQEPLGKEIMVVLGIVEVSLPPEVEAARVL
jgi:hypothetical protein